jgi:hypothetical protein
MGSREDKKRLAQLASEELQSTINERMSDERKQERRELPSSKTEYQSFVEKRDELAPFH